jgi:hypothetical protein
MIGDKRESAVTLFLSGTAPTDILDASEHFSDSERILNDS